MFEFLVFVTLIGIAYAHFKLHLTVKQAVADIKQVVGGGTK